MAADYGTLPKVSRLRAPLSRTLPGRLGLVVLLGLPAALAQPRPPPRSQGPGGPGGTGGAAVPAVVVTPPAVARRLLRATVTVMLGTRPVGLGVVVAPTGRIFTAFGPIARGGPLSVRYPDGRVVTVRIVARDVPWGVVLLEGGAGRWPEGLTLATADARGRDPVSWIAAGGTVATGGLLRRRRSFVGAEAALLRDAWELDPVPASQATGSGLVHHTTGHLVGLVLPAEDEQHAITGPITAYGAPWGVLRALMEQAGAPAAPWMGLVLEEASPGQESVHVASGGLRVTSVHPEGPGARAGLRAGPDPDIIIGAEGVRVQSLRELAAAIQGRQVGETISLRVVRGGAHYEVPLVLAERPVAP